MGVQPGRSLARPRNDRHGCLVKHVIDGTADVEASAGVSSARHVHINRRAISMRSPLTPAAMSSRSALEHPRGIYARIPRRESSGRGTRFFAPACTLLEASCLVVAAAVHQTRGSRCRLSRSIRSVLPGWALRRRWLDCLSETPLPCRRHCWTASIGANSGDNSHQHRHGVRLGRSDHSAAGSSDTGGTDRPGHNLAPPKLERRARPPP